MRTFKVHENTKEGMAERAEDTLGAAYPRAIWKRARVEPGRIFWAAWAVDTLGVVALAWHDSADSFVSVAPMTEAEPTLYTMAALVFASEIGAWMNAQAHHQGITPLGAAQTIAPCADVCQAFVESAGGE